MLNFERDHLIRQLEKPETKSFSCGIPVPPIYPKIPYSCSDLACDFPINNLPTKGIYLVDFLRGSWQQ